MPLKILHTADVHLGAKFLGLGEKGPEQRKQLVDTFESVVDKAASEKVDLFLIAGDLFDSNSVSRNLVGRVASLLARLAESGIRIFISPGTHDPLGPGSPYAGEDFCGIGGLVVFESEEVTAVRVPEFECTVYGNANTRPFENANPLAGIAVRDDSRWRVGLIHASFEMPVAGEDTYVVTAEQVAGCGLDYLALGHFHSTSERSSGDVTAYYCGSPEMIRMQKGDFGNALLVEVGDRVRVEALPVGRRKLEEISLRAEDLSATSLDDVLKDRSDPEKVLKVKISGLRPVSYPDVDEIAREFAERYFFLTLSDESAPAPSTVEPGSYPGDSAAGTFLRILQAELDGARDSARDEILEAMQVGLSLLEERGGR